MDLITFSISLGGFIFILFNTDFIYEYAKIFGFGKYFYEYSEWRSKNTVKFGLNQHYLPVYLRDKYSNFATRLFGCPICLSYFISLTQGVLCFYAGTIALIVFFILSLFYKILNKI